MKNVILVVGMHRSGTSAATGLLVKLGGAQPKNLMPAEGGNERGYFESQALMTFHDELLTSAGSAWTDWRQFNPAWYQSPAAPAFRRRAKQLFKEEFDGEPLVVLKDPRVCRFAPFWLEVLAGMKARARIVIPIRSPLEVAFSMRKRDGFPLATGALRWLRHIIDAEIASREVPRSIFAWDQLLRDWRSVAEKASADLGLSWPRLSDATAHEIDNFISCDLVHHRVSAPELAAHPDIHEWTMSAYRAMLKLAREPRSSSALKTLDKTRDAFNHASRMFGRTVFEEEIRSQDLLRKTAKLADERDHWSRQYDAARAELAGALQAKEQLSLELQVRAREASDLAQALAEQGRQREQVELALAREKSQNAQLGNDLEGRSAERALALRENRRQGRTIGAVETELMVTKETRRATGAGCYAVTLAPTSRDTLIIRKPEMIENKFERRFPTHQNAIDIFGVRWVGKIEEVYPGLTSGAGPYFSADRSPSIAAQYLGFEPGSLQGMNVLELGPLEGANTYQLAKLGADRILAIEANAEAFLKCLVVKEILQTPRCQFLLGDCLKFLQESHDQFDMIFCSGILYHMENPFELIKAMSAHTDRVFLWTTHYIPDGSAALARLPKPVVCDGLKLTFYERTYSDAELESGIFCGGNRPTASWLSREDIELCFRHFGYELIVHADEPGIFGPCITATGIRRMNNQVNSSAQTSPAQSTPWQNVTHVKLNRSNYKSIWNAVSISEDDAKFAAIGSLDEEAFKATGEDTKNMLLQFVGISPDDVVLEIGAGVGRVGAVLAPICKEWIGADVSENMLTHIKRRLGEFKNVRTVTTNGFDLSEIPSESIDVVYCTVVFMHLDEWERFGYIKEGFRVLKPGGRMLVDNVDLTSDKGWIFFEEVCAIPPQDRPAQISKTSTPQELETYFRRAGYDNVAQSHSDLWVMTYGKKPVGT